MVKNDSLWLDLPANLGRHDDRISNTVVRDRADCRVSFCYSGAADNGIGPLAGIDVIQVRQVNQMQESLLLDQQYPSYITNTNECVNVTTDTPVSITGSVWIMFRVWERSC